MLKERSGRLRPLRLKYLNAGVQILRFAQNDSSAEFLIIRNALRAVDYY